MIRYFSGEFNDEEKTKENTRYYNIITDGYFNLCLKVGKEYGISPKEIYDTWELPMLIITYTNLHNDEVNRTASEQDIAKMKKPPKFIPEEEFIYNITPEMLIENNEEKELEQENEAIELLRKMYEGKHD